ncbi:heterokaryon incompatibility protein-domain-containing protein [Podospora conica]|nr:heterokaryon incompatibility protein-domain-containing protein [Schizothecium conicum]
MPLCQHCTLVTIAPLVDHDMLFHPNLANITSGAEQGCEFCSLCWHALQKDNRGSVGRGQLDNLLRGESAWEEGKPWTPSMWLRGWHFSHRGRSGAKIEISCGMSSYSALRGPDINPSPSVKADLEIYELPGQPSNYKLAGRRSTVHQNPELYIQLIQAWLHNCCTQHTACRPASGNEPEMPTRVIDVGEGKDKPTFVRLVSTKGMREKYMALSYCWGSDTAGILTLNPSTYTTFTQGVKMSELARTHRETIFLAHAIGIRYIWIDALCIIQGDIADWERESKMMARVYGNAVLTVIAGRSAGTKDGFIANDLAGHGPPPCQLPVNGPGPVSSSTLTVGLCRNETVGPVTGRGWCFQEGKLSRRAVVFGEQQLIFRCATEEVFENGTARATNPPRNLKPVGNNVRAEVPLTPQEEALKVWYKSLFEFTQCSLSNPHDIFAASTAVAQQTSAALQSRYLAGIWEVDIVRGLLWRPHYQHPVTRGKMASAVRPKATKLTKESGSVTRSPSWSWAAVEGILSRAVEKIPFPIRVVRTRIS